jgi:hypothetical protein
MARSDNEHDSWIQRCTYIAASCVPTFGYKRVVETKPADRADLHDDLSGEKLLAPSSVQLDRCPFCGMTPYREVPEHGHYRTECCKQITVGCCNGETG